MSFCLLQTKFTFHHMTVKLQPYQILMLGEGYKSGLFYTIQVCSPEIKSPTSQHKFFNNLCCRDWACPRDELMEALPLATQANIIFPSVCTARQSWNSKALSRLKLWAALSVVFFFFFFSLCLFLQNIFASMSATSCSL